MKVQFDINISKDFFPGYVDVLNIMSDDDRVLYSISENDDGSINIRTFNFCKYNGRMLDTKMEVGPHTENNITISRKHYKEI